LPQKALTEARKIAAQYRIVTEPSGQRGAYLGWSIEMPGVLADGRSPSECADATFEALVTTVAAMLEVGRRPPSPARPGRRNEQINIRLTTEERLVLEEAAQQRGFQGISDFVRAAALRESNAVQLA
jgi:predicted RNase H-like HicB family nuclease